MSQRIGDMVFGGFLCIMAGWMAFLPDLPVVGWIAVAATGLLGGNGLWCGIRKKRSWVSRLGPLP